MGRFRPPSWGRSNSRYRRLSPLAIRPGEGRLTEPTAAARLCQPQRRPVPQTGHPARREERAAKPVLKDPIISALETGHPIDTAPPAGRPRMKSIIDLRRDAAIPGRRWPLSPTAAPFPSRTWICRRHRYRTCARTSACHHRRYGILTTQRRASLLHRHPAH